MNDLNIGSREIAESTEWLAMRLSGVHFSESKLNGGACALQECVKTVRAAHMGTPDISLFRNSALSMISDLPGIKYKDIRMSRKE